MSYVHRSIRNDMTTGNAVLIHGVCSFRLVTTSGGSLSGHAVARQYRTRFWLALTGPLYEGSLRMMRAGLDKFRALLRRAVSSPVSGPPMAKEASGRSQQEAIDWPGAEIRLASESDISTISEWVSASRKEWIGLSSDAAVDDEIAQWITSSVAACVLDYAPLGAVADTARPRSRGKKIRRPHGKAVAFATIVATTESEHVPQIEVGRLVVAPGWRRKGFGSAITWHLARAARKTLCDMRFRDSAVYVRVHKDNLPCHQLVLGLPFVAVENVHEHRFMDEVPECLWYRDTLSPWPVLMGEVLPLLRARSRTTHSDLAFSCGVNRATINMIESGLRHPSLELLRNICLLLHLPEIDSATLLLSAIGQKMENLASYDRFSPTDKHNLWIISDVIAELVDPPTFAATRRALERRCDRWFFIPAGTWEHQGRKLEARLTSKETMDDDAYDNFSAQVERHLRIYEAPPILCQFRIEIRDPGRASATTMTVEGEREWRIPVGSGRMEAIVSALQNAVMSVEYESGRQSESPSQQDIVLVRRYPKVNM